MALNVHLTINNHRVIEVSTTQQNVLISSVTHDTAIPVNVSSEDLAQNAEVPEMTDFQNPILQENPATDKNPKVTTEDEDSPAFLHMSPKENLLSRPSNIASKSVSDEFLGLLVSNSKHQHESGMNASKGEVCDLLELSGAHMENTMQLDLSIAIYEDEAKRLGFQPEASEMKVIEKFSFRKTTDLMFFSFSST